MYLSLAISKSSNIGSSIATWMSDRGAFRETFARQAIPMVWDYAEASPFADTGGSIDTILSKNTMVIGRFPLGMLGTASQADASTQALTLTKVVSTDPPYYDNIGYADLSDYFYVWLRRSLRTVFPDIFATLSVPKTEEIVATPFRHGSRREAESLSRRSTDSGFPGRRYSLTISISLNVADRPTRLTCRPTACSRRPRRDRRCTPLSLSNSAWSSSSWRNR